MSEIAAGDLNRRITFQRATRPAGRGKAGQEAWEDVFDYPVAAQVRDMLPSRSEKLADGLTIATRPARIRIRCRAGITPDMRIIYGSRIMRIVAGPAEVEEPRCLELMAADYTTQGSGA